jgi:hypothetical protein
VIEEKAAMLSVGGSTRFGRVRSRRAGLFPLALVLALLSLGFVVDKGAAWADEAKPVKAGTVKIEQTQIAFIGSGNLGGGTLYFGDKAYPFTIGGLGYGGFGVSKMEATGTVYDLKSPKDFEGLYVQARYGFVVGDTSTGELWLTNDKGVGMSLKAKRTGLALSLGADGIYIEFD